MPFVAPTEYTFGHEAGQPTDPIPLLPEEDAIRDFAFATVVATKNIKEGELITKENTWPKRPGIGEISAKDHDLIIGKKVNKKISKDSHLSFKDIILNTN